MLITIVGVIIALGYFLYTPRLSWLKVSYPYVVGVFCLWVAALAAVPAVENALVRQIGFLILFLTGSLLCVDMLVSAAMWLMEKLRGFFRKTPTLPDYLMEIWMALEQMASCKVGALIVLQRKQPLRPHMKGGIAFDAEIRSEILLPLFLTSSPVHDGALVVAKGRIQTVKGILPLAALANQSPKFGTRHRAAIGITEKTDAIVLVASEERGQISVAHRGSLTHIRDRAEFLKTLQWVLKGKNILKLKNANFIVTTKVLEDLA